MEFENNASIMAYNCCRIPTDECILFSVYTFVRFEPDGGIEIDYKFVRCVDERCKLLR